MRHVIQRPAAAAMIGSMRAMGYSFDSALADIIDNSIAASARRVDIILDSKPAVTLAIIDDGTGMDEDTLIAAMRHGSRDPRQPRSPEDLGRFGLGLKTASLSQCRRLTVASINRGNFAATRWDLDEVTSKDDWLLAVLNYEDIASLPAVGRLMDRGQGTVVIWQDIDRAKIEHGDERAGVERLLDDARGRLALTFHRFLSEDGLEIQINWLALPVVDPFLTTNRRTERLPEENIRLVEGVVHIQPYILPHLSDIRESDVRDLGGLDGLRENQGFYLYRNRRLICYGTWFKIIRLDQLTKLARVSIDIPNTMDGLWSIDIRKATASPPQQVRDSLKRFIDRIAERSSNVFRERRRRTKSTVLRVWNRDTTRGGFRYSLNREHPFVAKLATISNSAARSDIEELLQAIEIALPVDAIYADIAADHVIGPAEDERYAELLVLASALLRLKDGTGDLIDPSDLLMIEPFSLYKSVTRRIIEDLKQ